MSPRTMSGLSPASRIASAPPSTPDQDRAARRGCRRAGRAGPGGRSCPRTTIRTWRSRNSVRVRRQLDSAPPSSSPSSRTWAIVFSANAASASSIRWRWSESCSASSVGVQHAARREHRPVAADLAAHDHHRIAVLKLLEQRRRGRVDQAHAGPRQEQRAGVRIAPGGGRRDVDDRPHPGRHQVLGGDPVEVGVVDDRDVAGAQALDQLLGPAAEPGVAVDGVIGARRGGAVAPQPAAREESNGRGHRTPLIIRKTRPPRRGLGRAGRGMIGTTGCSAP